MLDTGLEVSTNDFTSMSAEERKDKFNAIDKSFQQHSGEWLEIMFQKKDYQDMGYNRWNDFVNKELTISDGTARKRRDSFKKTLNLGRKIEPKTETFLKPSMEVLDAELVDVLPLTSGERQEIMKKHIPKSHHKEASQLTDEQLLIIKQRTTDNIKAHWRYYNISDEVYSTYVNKDIKRSTEGQSRLYVDFHTIEGLASVIDNGRDVDQTKWLKDKIKSVHQDMAHVAGNTLRHRQEAEAEERRVEKLPCIKYESSTDLARKCAKLLFDEGLTIKSFQEEVRKAYRDLNIS